MHPELNEIMGKIPQYSDKNFAKISSEDLSAAKKLISDYVDQLSLKFGAEESRKILQNSPTNIIHIAARFGFAEQIKKIIELVSNVTGIDAPAGGKDPSYYVNIRDDNFLTPLHHAAKGGWIDAVKHLLEYGAEKDVKASAKDREWTPIHYAAKFGHTEVVMTLIFAGVDKETKTAFGLTPLLVAAEFGHAELVGSLLKLGANKNVKTIAENHGMNALHYGAVGGFVDVVQVLVAEGIDKEEKTASGFAALHFAASSGSAEVAEILLKNGANIFSKTQTGNNSLYVAASKNQKEMAELFLQWGSDDLELALAAAKGNDNKEIVQKIEQYQKAIKNLFSLKNLPADLAETIKSFTKQNLHERKIIMAQGVSFNGYAIFNLSQISGIFSKEKVSLMEVMNKKDDNLSAAFGYLEKTIGLYKA